MKTQRRGLLLLRLARPLIHAVIIMLSFYTMYHLRQVTDLIPFVQLRIPIIDLQETLMFAVISAVMFLLLGAIRGIYTLFRPIHAYYNKFLTVWGLRVVSISFIAYIGLGFIFVNGISRFILLVGAFGVLIVVTIMDLFINAMNTKLEQKRPYRILLLAVDPETVREVTRVLHQYRRYSVDVQRIQFFDTETAGYDIIIVAGSVEKGLLQSTADAARINGQMFYHIGDTLFLEDLISVPERLGPLIMLEYKASPLEGWRRVIKRIFDLCCSLVLTIVLLPVMLIIALAIKLDSPGPVLYLQKRVGKNTTPFTFIKFRSMFTHLSVGENYGGEEAWKLKEELMNSEQNVREGVLQKIQNDPRVTKVGRFLRKTSLDELPNLFSVIWGDMSLVGPRPHELFEVEQYKDWQKRVLSIKPGITGYAQIFGRDQLSFDDEATLDLYYIQNRSMFLDLYVLLATLRVVFLDRDT